MAALVPGKDTNNIGRNYTTRGDVTACASGSTLSSPYKGVALSQESTTRPRPGRVPGLPGVALGRPLAAVRVCGGRYGSVWAGGQ
jgi:hypothetical protein